MLLAKVKQNNTAFNIIFNAIRNCLFVCADESEVNHVIALDLTDLGGVLCDTVPLG